MSNRTSNIRLNDPDTLHQVSPVGECTNSEFYQVLLNLIENREPLAVATVIAVHGSASVRTGSKAILSQQGRNVFGWVGGGCAESFVIQQAQEAILSGAPRVVSVDLNDELFGVGMPCGGQVDVYIEPITPPRRVLILGTDLRSQFLAECARKLGFAVISETDNLDLDELDYVVFPPGTAEKIVDYSTETKLVSTGLPIKTCTTSEEVISFASRLLSLETGCSGLPLWKSKGMPSEYWPSQLKCPRCTELVLVGHNRITENLAALAVSMGWTVSVNSLQAIVGEYPAPVCLILNDDAYQFEEVTSGSFVVIATQHKGDHVALRNLLPRQPAYIGLIASRTRAELVMERLKSDGLLELARHCVHAPCGLDLGSRAPFEIALSIICELISYQSRPDKL